MHENDAMDESGMAMVNYTDQVSDAFSGQLNLAIENYQVLKDALVQTDYQKAKTAAAQTLEALQNVDGSLLEGQPRSHWMEQMQPMQQHLEAMVASEDIEAMRMYFANLTEPMKNTIAAFGADQTMYVQYCPMAFNNEGASWISDEMAIRNPYFGDKMLKCGSVKETLATN